MPVIKRINAYTKPNIGELVEVDSEVCVVTKMQKMGMTWRCDVSKANPTQTLMYEVMES